MIFLRRLMCCLGYQDTGEKKECSVVGFFLPYHPLQQSHANTFQWMTSQHILIWEKIFLRDTLISFLASLINRASGIPQDSVVKPSLWLIKDFVEDLLSSHEQWTGFTSMKHVKGSFLKISFEPHLNNFKL